MSDEPTRRRVSAAQVAKEVQRAQEYLVEQSLMAFLEVYLGRVPSNDEIAANQIWVQFSNTPLTVYKKDGVEFVQFWVWARKEAIALGFYDMNDLTALSFVRVPADEWPTALKLYVQQYPKS